MKKMNNKGFSLVELIIVIAIMAILIVVLAPQYLKYVERSRNSTDLQNATEMKIAVETFIADPQSTFTASKDQTVILTVDNSKTTPSGTATDVAKDALEAAGLNPDNIKCVSKTAWTGYTLTGTIQANGGVEWTYANTGTDTTAFEKAMNGN